MPETVVKITFRDVLSLFVALLIEAIRGPGKLHEIDDVNNTIEALMGFSHQGYHITVHCKEVRYRCEYKRWYVPNKVKSTFYVWADISEGAPDKLVEYCKQTKAFPKLLVSWIPSSAQREAAIRAYLDLLIRQIQDSQKSA